MSLDDDPGKPSQRERRLERETKRLRYELEVFGRQTPMLRAMIEGAPDALALVSLDGEVFEHNRAFSQLAGADVPCNGRTVAACLGRPTHAPGAPITELLDRAALRASLEAPQTLVGALGDDLVEARLSGFGDDRGVVLSIRVLDTESHQARELSHARARLQALGLQLENQRQIDEAERLESLSMLAGSLAHDLNNALAVVTCNLEFLHEDIDDPSVTELLDGATAGAKQVGELVQRLRSFSRDGGLLRARLSLSTWLPHFARSVANGHEAEIQIVETDQPLWIEADESQLSRVALNLLINAFQAARGAGRVPAVKLALTASDNGELQEDSVRPARAPTAPHARVTIEDNGPGISADAFAKLFVPFHTTKQAGTGLGLAGAARIVEMHGGGIGASNLPDGGARFVVTLPLCDGEADASDAMATSSAAAQLQGVTVLLMDDEPHVRRIVQRALRSAGAEVLALENGEQVLEEYAACRERGVRPICLLDIVVVHGMNGLETIRALRSKWPDVRALACTGHATVDLGREYRQLGFDSWLAKPFTIRALHEAIAALID